MANSGSPYDTMLDNASDVGAQKALDTLAAEKAKENPPIDVAAKAHAAAKATGRFVKDVTSSSLPFVKAVGQSFLGVGQSMAGVQGHTPEEIQALSRIHGTAPGSQYTAEQAFQDAPQPVRALAGTAINTAEWLGTGEMAKGLGFVAEPVVEGISGALRDALVKAGLRNAVEPIDAELGSIALGQKSATDEAIQALAKRHARGKFAKTVVAQAGVGAAIGASQAALAKSEGLQPNWTANMTLGAMFGAAAGMYEPAMQNRIAKAFPKLNATLGSEDRATMNAVDQIATRLVTRDKVTPQAAAKAIVNVMNNTATDVERAQVQAVVADMPHLAKNKLIAHLFNNSRVFATPEVVVDESLAPGTARVTYEDANRIPHTQEVTFDHLARLDNLAKQGRIYMTRVEGGTAIVGRYTQPETAGRVAPVNMPDEKAVGKMLDSLETGSLVDGMFGGQRGLMPRSIDAGVKSETVPGPQAPLEVPRSKGPAIPKIVETLNDKTKETAQEQETETRGTSTENGPTAIRPMPSTVAGTPIIAPGTEAILPPGASVRTDVPNAPLFVQPTRLTRPQAEIIQHARGNDPRAFTTFIINGARIRSLTNMVEGGLLKPNDIKNPDIALQITNKLADAALITPTDTPRYRMLAEHADEFMRRTTQLRGDPQPPKTVTHFVREPDNGDIVRVVKHDDKTVDLVDKRGHRATVDKASVDIPVVTPDDVFSTAENDAENLKQFEALFGTEPTDLTQSKSTRAVPKVPNIEGEIARFPDRESAINALMTRTEGQPNALEFAIIKQRLATDPKFSKGAITFARGEETGILGAMANKLGGKLFKTPQGYVFQDATGQKIFHTELDAVDYMRKYGTIKRIGAEQEQVIDEGKNIPIPAPSRGLSAILDTAQRLSKDPSSMRDTYLQYGHSIIPTGLRMQKTALASMGEGGKRLASMSDLYSIVNEMTNARDYIVAQDAIRKMIKLGATGHGIEDGSADPRAIALYKKFILPIFDRQFNDAKTFGINGEPVTDRIYFPHVFHFSSEDVPPDLLIEMRERGLAANVEDAKNALNAPDAAVEHSMTTTDPTTGMKRPRTKADQIELLQWLRKKQAYLSGSLSKDRKGNAGWEDDIEKAITNAIRSRNRRLAEAAVFGPNMERRDGALAMIGGDPAFGSAAIEHALKITNDIRGRVHIPVHGFNTSLMDFARGSLGLSAPKHLVQGAVLASRGYSRFLRSALHLAFHPIRDTQLTEHVGAALDKTRFELTEDDRELMQSLPTTVLKRFASTYGKVGSLALHFTINTIRKVATNVGMREFDGVFDKALKGNENALGLLRSVLKFNVSPEDLAGMDREELRNIYAKALADWTGFTFRPQDMPELARNETGRMLLQFRSYQWQSVANWFGLMTDKNLSKAYRAKFITRMMMAVPVVALLDAKIRHKAGADTIGSEELLAGFDRIMANPSTAEAASVEIQSWLNAHLLGIASDYVNGLNTLDPNVTARSMQLEPSAASIPIDVSLAAAFAYAAHLDHDPKYSASAMNQLSSVGGGLGLALSRNATGKKKIRLPKHNLIRETLDKVL